MYHYNYAVLISDKQKELEKVTNEAWKYAKLEQDSFFNKIKRKFAIKSKDEKICNDVICEC